MQPESISAGAAIGGVAVALISATIAYREYRLSALRRLVLRFESERYADRFWRLSMAYREYTGETMLYPNPRTGTLDAWAVTAVDDWPVLVTEIWPMGRGDQRLQELVKEALGPGYTDELRADFVDFYNLV
ncbi:MAG: hypothetical protein PF636_08830, partial [Actinomycetota bacterium]|nr:hypothetical protein [Actinomycetota bacterium]